ncbi:hypothetical protein GJ496_008189 [Pomphorhynchus laevis]|nr:hypothetical protein GJ496_008189 [Pomphorhynchus laevis]
MSAVSFVFISLDDKGQPEMISNASSGERLSFRLEITGWLNQRSAVNLYIYEKFEDLMHSLKKTEVVDTSLKLIYASVLDYLIYHKVLRKLHGADMYDYKKMFYKFIWVTSTDLTTDVCDQLLFNNDLQRSFCKQELPAMKVMLKGKNIALGLLSRRRPISHFPDMRMQYREIFPSGTNKQSAKLNAIISASMSLAVMKSCISGVLQYKCGQCWDRMNAISTYQNINEKIRNCMMTQDIYGTAIVQQFLLISKQSSSNMPFKEQISLINQMTGIKV